MNGQTCATVAGAGFTGNLLCKSDCSGFDKTGCKKKKFTAVVEIDTTVEKTIPKKECLDKWKQTYSAIKSSIEYDSRLGSSRNPESRGYYNGSIICFFNGTREKARKCIGHLDELSKEMKKGCNSGKIKKDVKKKIKVSRQFNPFDDAIKKLNRVQKWYAMDSLYLEQITFAKQHLNPSENEYAQLIADTYSQYSDANLSFLKFACTLFPSIDKKISKDYGVNLFSCSKILNDFPTYLDKNCNTNDTVRTKYFPLTLYGKGKDSLICDLNTAKYRYFTKIDSALGLCDKEKEGQGNMEFVCHNGTWITWNEHYTRELKFEKGKIAKSERDSSILYFKDFRDGRIYRATKIGSQIWMAENLKYNPLAGIDICGIDKDYCKTECYEKNDINCELFGRYYKWDLAMDSLGLFSTNGFGCGFKGVCFPTYPVRGICPEGWHLPDTTEWKIFNESIGKAPQTIQAKKFWENATDSFKFSAIPLGFYDRDYYKFNNVNEAACFWSANEKYSNYYAERQYAYYFYLDAKKTSDSPYLRSKTSMFNIRCVKDSEK